MVLTILKNISHGKDYPIYSHILWKIKNVWNHQPVVYYPQKIDGVSSCSLLKWPVSRTLQGPLTAQSSCNRCDPGARSCPSWATKLPPPASGRWMKNEENGRSDTFCKRYVYIFISIAKCSSFFMHTYNINMYLYIHMYTYICIYFIFIYLYTSIAKCSCFYAYI